MPIEKLRPSYTFTEERIKELQSVVPEAFTDGKINWDVLHEALGEYLEDESNEHFGLTWPGKREARRLAAIPSKGTLVPVPGEGINEESTYNVFIEGENLEVLKLLQKSYARRVKMIYIDPPYNTGNDFVYADDYSEPLISYLNKTGQIDDSGNRLSTNTRSGGRFHSNWLSMIYPRLIISRQLLCEDGVIFISIDDHEYHNLRLLLNEIFGEENFVSSLPWKGKGGGADNKYLMQAHEYVLLYAKNKQNFIVGEQIKTGENYPKFDPVVNRNYKTQLARKWGSNSRREDRPNLYYSITAPNGDLVYPKLPDGNDGCWRWSREKMDREISKGNVEFIDNNNTWIVYEKIWEPLEGEAYTKKYSTWLDTVGSTATGTKEVQQLFGKRVFDFPKPVQLLTHLINIANLDDSDIVLDFFAGSCTTAHAVLEINRQDDKNYQFIMIQLPETTPPDSIARKEGFKTISSIGKERTRLVINEFLETHEGMMKLFQDQDLGFRVWNLDRSNFKDWQKYQGDEITQLETLFNQIESPMIDSWKPQNLLTEILLLQGFPLHSHVIPLEDFTRNKLLRVSSRDNEHDMFVCLDNKIAGETIDQLNISREDILVCLDNALIDEAKVQLADHCNLKVI